MKVRVSTGSPDLWVWRSLRSDRDHRAIPISSSLAVSRSRKVTWFLFMEGCSFLFSLSSLPTRSELINASLITPERDRLVLYSQQSIKVAIWSICNDLNNQRAWGHVSDDDPHIEMSESSSSWLTWREVSWDHECPLPKSHSLHCAYCKLMKMDAMFHFNELSYWFYRDSLLTYVRGNPFHYHYQAFLLQLTWVKIGVLLLQLDKQGRNRKIKKLRLENQSRLGREPIEYNEQRNGSSPQAGKQIHQVP